MESALEIVRTHRPADYADRVVFMGGLAVNLPPATRVCW